MRTAKAIISDAIAELQYYAGKIDAWNPEETEVLAYELSAVLDSMDSCADQVLKYLRYSKNSQAGRDISAIIDKHFGGEEK